MAGAAGRSRGTRLAAAAVMLGALLGLIFLGYTLRQPVLQARPACHAQILSGYIYSAWQVLHVRRSRCCAHVA